MSEVFEWLATGLLKIMSVYGGKIAFILAIIGFTGATIYFKFKEHIINFFEGLKKTEIHPIQKISLDTHELFPKFQKLLYVEIPYLDLLPSKPVKQRMFRDLLIYFVKTVQEECIEMAKIDRDDWSQDKWVVEITNHANRIVHNFKIHCIDNGIPEIVFEKFNRWNQQTLDLLYDHIANIGNSDMYHSNTERTNTLFLIIGLLILVTIGDAEKTIKELNGEVAGKNYKGFTIED